VMGRCAGAFSEYALMDAAEAMAKPASLSWEEAASIPLTFLVASDMLVLQGRLQPREWLLINGVSSGVAVASLQLGKLLGARASGPAGSDGTLMQLRRLGLHVALRSRGAGLAGAVTEAPDAPGAELVLTAVRGSVFAESLRAMAFQGRL